MKLIVIGCDTAAMEARAAALMLNNNIEVICVQKDAVEDLLTTEWVNKEQAMQLYPLLVDHKIHITGGRQQGRTYTQQLLYNLRDTQVELTLAKQEPHWVTRNAKGRRY